MSDVKRDARRIPPAECTEHPWWAIIDPRQMMKPSAHSVASMVTGPFFSRESAQSHLDGRRYAFGANACVYCFGGYWSKDWREFCVEPRR